MTTPSVDFSRYNPPGVFTEAVPGPQLGVNSTAPLAVGIFGDTLRFRTDFETIVIPPDASGVAVAAATLRQQGIDPTTLVVRDVATGTVYALNTDYTVIDHVGADTVPFSNDDTYNIKRVLSGTLLANAVVQVSYNFTDPTYFNNYTFYAYSDVRDAYGVDFDAAGNLISELTFAARLAFANGAQIVIAAAVKHSGSGAPTTNEYTNALAQLANESNIAIICCANGSQALFQPMQQHVDLQSNQSHERRAIIGRDGSVTPVSSATRITNAGAIHDARVLMVSPATATYFNPQTSSFQTVGSHFMAAALAGLAVSLNPATPLTRKSISGFAGIPESLSEAQKNLEAQGGLCVIEQTPRGLVRVRHGLTTNPTNLLTKEWSIVGQQDNMAFTLRDFLDGDGLIGGIISDLTLTNVKASADSALQSLVAAETIQNYQNLAVRQLTSSADVIEVSFEWLASVPLNYIVVSYSINVTSGDVTTADTITNTTGG